MKLGNGWPPGPQINPNKKEPENVSKDKGRGAFMALYDTERWRYARAEVLERDEHRCQNCQADWDLEVHHLKYVGNHPADTPPKFLVTLCNSCHVGWHEGTNPLRNYFMGVFDE